MMPMKCAWQELLQILPPWLRTELDTQEQENLSELRLRSGDPPRFVGKITNTSALRTITTDDLGYIINAASRYSPWSASTIAQGYLTAQGGHRIGICGDVVLKEGRISGIRKVSSLCIRVARDYEGIALGIPDHCSVLIVGPPGAGKTTLLRYLIRQRSNLDRGSVSVVDERGELFPVGFQTGRQTDILTGASKGEGIVLMLRTMGPSTIAVDEITEENDLNALAAAAGCGVRLLATAHGRSLKDMKQRPIYRRLFEQGIFDYLIILQEDKSWRTERIFI
jgi:stage III sporulation protein AA